GRAVAISGDLAVITTENTPFLFGGAYFFERSGGTWTERQVVMTPASGTGGDDFGASVSFRGYARGGSLYCPQGGWLCVGGALRIRPRARRPGAPPLGQARHGRRRRP